MHFASALLTIILSHVPCHGFSFSSSADEIRGRFQSLEQHRKTVVSEIPSAAFLGAEMLVV